MNSLSIVKKLCVYGIGGVGGYFGGKVLDKIGDTLNGYPETYFIARGEHLYAIVHAGLTVVTPARTIIGKPTLATDDINSIPDPDLVLLCVKSYGLDDALISLKPKINKDTVIIPLLNGVDIYERIREHISDGIILPACVFVGTHIDAPGVIRQNGGNGKILFGRDPKHLNYLPESTLEFFKEMEIDFDWMNDPYPAIWGKYIFIAAFGLITAHTGYTLGELLNNDESLKSVREVMNEIQLIATAKGIKLPDNIIDESVAKANNFPPETKTSYQRDIEAKGEKNEGDLFGGAIIKLGEELGISVPVTKSLYSDIQRRFG